MVKGQDSRKNISDFLSVTANICCGIRDSLNKISDTIKETAQEICLRSGRIAMVLTPNESYFLDEDGGLSQKSNQKGLIVSSVDLNETLKSICNFSIYSFQNQIKNSFITMRGGHRAGICGTAVINQGEIINLAEISSINFRIAREFMGCSEKIFEKFGFDLGGTLIAGPPASGKTTILRDIARKISSENLNGKFIKTVVIDERREIASCYGGVPQKDVGFSDVLADFPKGEGILRAARTFSPEIIICDEIGNLSDAEAVREVLNSGVGIIASVHAKTPEEIANSNRISPILNSGAIKRVILLENRGKPGIIKDYYVVNVKTKNKIIAD
ncbi:MAG: stage III sporulation protein AA [Oscillospiraceae bacterium]|jgi:stage III sporulation protein AA|nr:stage III sporulation protein AA [Oscillospiraceae bacterium]